MVLTLYAIHASPPVRTVLITAKALGLELNEVVVNLLEGDHLDTKFTKLNPQHTVPTLDDDGFIIWDSHAIITYLVSKYGKDDSLYPKDLQKRAIIDQRLHFDSGIAFPRLRGTAEPIIFFGKQTIDQIDKDRIVEVYEFLEKFLDKNQWIAGNELSLADFSLIASVSSLDKMQSINGNVFPKLVTWFQRCEALPAYEANKKGLETFNQLINSKIK